MKKIIAALLAVSMVLALAACGAQESAPAQGEEPSSSENNTASEKSAAELLSLEDRQGDWNLLTEVEDQDGKSVEIPACYVLSHVAYCTAPLDENVQFIDIYVPAAYLEAGEKGYRVSENGSVSNEAGTTYTAATAPVILQNSIDAYKQSDPISIGDARRGGNVGTYADFIRNGYVLVSLACRGSNSKVDGYAPASIIDMKAAVRMLKANDSLLPGDMNKIIATGGSAGGGIACLLGASGNSELYLPYLEEAGAIMDSTDDIFAVAAYCPITNLDVGDAAYEWLHASETQLAPVNHGNDAEPSADAPATMQGEFSAFQLAMQTKLLEEFDEYLVSVGLDPQKFDDGFYAQINTCIADYVDQFVEDPAAFSEEFPYLVYDGERVTAVDTVSFVSTSMPRAKGCTAFDTLYLGSNENKLFHKTHFSAMVLEVMRELAGDYDEAASYVLRYESNIDEDKVALVKLMSPDTFMTGAAESDIAPNWRFRIGTNDGDLGAAAAWLMACLLDGQPGIDTVDYGLVWGKPHGTADYSFDGIRDFVDGICG